MTADWDAMLAELQKACHRAGADCLACRAAKALVSAALRERESAKEVERLRAKFEHIHDARGPDPDTCLQCGWNFRDSIHKRYRPLAAEKGEQT